MTPWFIEESRAETPEEYYDEVRRESTEFAWWYDWDEHRISGLGSPKWRRPDDRSEREPPAGYPARLCANNCGHNARVGSRYPGGWYHTSAFCGDTCRKRWYARRERQTGIPRPQKSWYFGGVGG